MLFKNIQGLKWFDFKNEQPNYEVVKLFIDHDGNKKCHLKKYAKEEGFFIHPSFHTHLIISHTSSIETFDNCIISFSSHSAQIEYQY